MMAGRQQQHQQQPRRLTAGNSKRWRLGSYLLCGSLSILVSQLIIHRFLLPLSSSSSSTTTSSSHMLEEQQRSISSPSSRTRRRAELNTTLKSPDGFFNNVPIYYHDGASLSHTFPPRYSAVHCVGETHHLETAWMYRSCHYSHFCFDTNSSDFVLLRSPAERLFAEQKQKQQQQQQQQPKGIYLSTTLSSTTTSPTNLQVAVGGINPRWMSKGKDMGIHKVKWSPRVLDAVVTTSLSFYELPDHVVLIPFHSFAAHNIGHLLWDDFLPIYTLLSMFDLMINDDDTTTTTNNDEQSQQYQHMLLRVVLKHAMYASCDRRPKRERACKANFERFLPAMGVDPTTYSTTKQYQLHFVSSSSTLHPKSSLICAKNGVAGIGMLTDHGFVDHGWLYSDMKHPHNHGRGPMLAKFRNYLVHNLGLNDKNRINDHRLLSPPFQIIVSTNSSRNRERQLLFQEQINAVQHAFSSHQVNVKNVTLSQLPLKEQVELALGTDMFITACGGGAVTAMFLPKGATLIVYYPERGGFYFPTLNYTGTPALLDWDLLNNLAHLRVHWFPIGTMNSKESIDTLLHLLRLELETLKTSAIV